MRGKSLKVSSGVYNSRKRECICCSFGRYYAIVKEGNMHKSAQTILVLLLVFYCMCSREPAEGPEWVLRCGEDTLRSTELLEFCPDTTQSDSVRLISAARQIALSRICAKCGTRSCVADTVASACTERLRLHTSLPWSSTRVKTLLGSVRGLGTLMQKHTKPAKVAAVVDSLFTLQVRSPGYPVVAVDESFWGSDKASPGQDTTSHALCPTKRVALYTDLFYLPAEAAGVVVEFSAPDTAADSLQHHKVSSMVKGLIDEGGTQESGMDRSPVSPGKKAGARKRRHSKNQKAWQHRSKKSVADSIATHRFNMKQLYKKALRRNPDMKGTVWLTFFVDAHGDVRRAVATQSSCNDSQFVAELKKYAQKIKFQQIPSDAGQTRFVFPFTFNPQM